MTKFVHLVSANLLRFATGKVYICTETRQTVGRAETVVEKDEYVEMERVLQVLVLHIVTAIQRTRVVISIIAVIAETRVRVVFQH